MDVEFRAGFDDLIRSTGGKRIVLSMHDFDGVPGDLAARVRAMRAVGAEVVKVAVKVHSLWDNLAFFDLRDAAGKGSCVVLRQPGLPPRALPAQY